MAVGPATCVALLHFSRTGTALGDWPRAKSAGASDLGMNWAALTVSVGAAIGPNCRASVSLGANQRIQNRSWPALALRAFDGRGYSALEAAGVPKVSDKSLAPAAASRALLLPT